MDTFEGKQYYNVPHAMSYQGNFTVPDFEVSATLFGFVSSYDSLIK